jgi:hypothetical protein
MSSMHGTPDRSRDGRRAAALAALLAILMSAPSGGDAAQAVARPRTITTS